MWAGGSSPPLRTRFKLANYPPTILIHGTADTDVPYTLSRDMDAMLGKADVAHELITVDGAEHRLVGATPEELSRVAGRAVKFVKAYTSKSQIALDAAYTLAAPPPVWLPNFGRKI